MKPTLQKKVTKVTPEQAARFDALKSRKINYDDIPSVAGTFSTDWVKHVPKKLTHKKHTSIRLDSEVIEFLKAETPTGYIARINQILAVYVAVKKQEQSQNNAIKA